MNTYCAFYTFFLHHSRFLPRIPSSPTHLPPIRPRLTCRSLGVSTRADLPKLDRATTTTPDSLIDPNIIQEQHRRRSLSSPQIPTSPTQKKPPLVLVPRSAVVTHSWGELEKDESRVKKSKGRVITPPPARTPESPTTVACRQLGTFTSWEFPNSEDVSPACSSTILPTHLESITQLNLKLSAGEELTIEELMRGLKDAFARYYSVLDTAAELKRKYEGENEGLRMKVGVMEEQKRRDDAELKRLRKALREGRERDEDDSDRRERPQTANTKRPISWQADNGNNVNLRRTKTSNVQPSATTTTTSRPSLTITLDPGPPPAGPLPPIPCNQGVLMTPVSPAFKFEGRRRRVTVPVPGPTSST